MAGLLLVGSACGVSGLSFVQDDRVEIVTPEDRSQVRLPVTVSWTVRNFEVTGPTGSADPDAGYFGVFLDVAPQPPGEPLEWFAEDDRQCEVTPGCPDEAYFAARGIFATSETSITIERIPEIVRPDERRFREFHEVVVVLLDGRGQRIGESAFTVDFELERDAG